MTIKQSTATSTISPDMGAMSLQKRIGSTTYVVNVHFSETTNETIEDKILRLMKSEVSQSA